MIVTLSFSDEAIPLNLTEINFNKNEKLTDYLSIISEKKNDNIIDDFREIFNPMAIIIVYFSLWIIYVTLSNAFYALLILYEKYGEDIMKRSINNQLVSQLGLAMILHNCIFSTIFLLRFIFGPLYFGIVVFEVFIANMYVSWVLLVLTEISVVKALSICKFSWIVGIDENFAGRFLLTFSLGYCFVSQTARFVHKFYSITFFLNLFFSNKTFFKISDTFLDHFFIQCIFSFCPASNLRQDQAYMDQYITQLYFCYLQLLLLSLISKKRKKDTRSGNFIRTSTSI